jgi:rhodanese-related sulfurtransferase
MVRQIGPNELKRMLDHGDAVYLVDVRQPWEHDIARLPNSHLIPLDQLAQRADEVAPPQGALVVAYCHHGVRSVHAAALLQQAGVGDVASLAGGIDAWSLTVDACVQRY